MYTIAIEAQHYLIELLVEQLKGFIKNQISTELYYFYKRREVSCNCSDCGDEKIIL